MAISSTTGPFARGTAMISGLFPMTRLRAAPWRQVGHGVGPADADQPRLCGLPAVSSPAHPVVGIAQRHASHAVLASESDGTLHRGQRSQIARAAVAIPTLQRAKSSHYLRLGGRIHRSVTNRDHEARKAVDAVRVHSVARGFGKQPCASVGAIGANASPRSTFASVF